ncbi:REP-associated tyrosine transposase [Azomonas macrocytogenes]|uniref:Putative transposase n=1 Tax=Azomonas macrocytogenes TaxID=69962 RepID=A0A839T744_AZOMA|nr:transposase [Azomonas macrocytogenes]MBB3104670.1 putative transposase [Azomonas macrocytogenes]
MSGYRRATVPGGTYFFTVVTERRQPILNNADIRQALREAIVLVRETLPFRIDGWVLLPDHLHAMWTLPEGDADFSSRWQRIKRHVTHSCGATYARPDYLTPRRIAKQCGTLWQHRFWEHLIRDEQDFRRHLDYLHGNPLKHGLVERVADWPWSSFHRWVRQGVYPNDWGGDDLG